MKKHSAGLLVYRSKSGGIEVLVAHMGGPWFTKKDEGAWTIPKGEYNPEKEDPLVTAKREFKEELGQPAPEGEYKELGSIDQKNNKTVIAWAVEADVDIRQTKSNTFKIEWPPRSGKIQEFPEIDRAEWVNIHQASNRLVQGQAEFLSRLADALKMPLESKEPSQRQSSLF